MEFFVPTVDGSEHMYPGRDEKVWDSCRKQAELEVGAEALDRRVYRLEYEHAGSTLTAQVGEPCEGYCDCQVVTAIIAFPNSYKICCVVKGRLMVGATPIVRLEDALGAEDFGKPS
ncbi:MAG: hypothetical protein AB7T48_13360 [Solirubrobacterales bacterium]